MDTTSLPTGTVTFLFTDIEGGGGGAQRGAGPRGALAAKRTAAGAGPRDPPLGAALRDNNRRAAAPRLSRLPQERAMSMIPSDSADRIESEEVLDLLASLVQKSLVFYEEDEQDLGRYRLLETVRQYARDRLLDAEEAEAVRERHRDWFLALAEQAAPELRGPEPVAWLERLEMEHNNLRAALAWLAAQGQGEVGLRLGVALGWFWFVRGYLREGREYLARLLAVPGAEARTAARAWALTDAGLLAWGQGDYRAARALHEERLDICRELGDKEGIGWSLNHLGEVARDQGDHGGAGALHEESLAIFRELENKEGIAWSLIYLGLVSHNQGDYRAARALHAESLAIFREVGDKPGIANSLVGLGWSAHCQADNGAARAFFQEGLALHREIGYKRGIATDLTGLAVLAVAQARPECAARLMGAAEGLREAIGASLPPADRAEHDCAVAAVRTALGEAAFAAAWAEGRAMSLEVAIKPALEE